MRQLGKKAINLLFQALGWAFLFLGMGIAAFGLEIWTLHASALFPAPIHYLFEMTDGGVVFAIALLVGGGGVVLAVKARAVVLRFLTMRHNKITEQQMSVKQDPPV